MRFTRLSPTNELPHFILGIVIGIKALDRTPRLILMIKGKLNQGAIFRALECRKDFFIHCLYQCFPTALISPFTGRAPQLTCIWMSKSKWVDIINKTWPQILISWHQFKTWPQNLISWHQFKTWPQKLIKWHQFKTWPQKLIKWHQKLIKWHQILISWHQFKSWHQKLIRWHQKLIRWHQFKLGTKN